MRDCLLVGDLTVAPAERRSESRSSSWRWRRNRVTRAASPSPASHALGITRGSPGRWRSRNLAWRSSVTGQASHAAHIGTVPVRDPGVGDPGPPAGRGGRSRYPDLRGHLAQVLIEAGREPRGPRAPPRRHRRIPPRASPSTNTTSSSSTCSPRSVGVSSWSDVAGLEAVKRKLELSFLGPLRPRRSCARRSVPT